MLTITAFIAAPLLFFCSRKEWLNWWQAVMVGLGCGALFTALFALATNAEWVDRFGLKSALLYSGVGLIAALFFWWLGVFRNSAFPFVSRRLPYSMLLIIPVLAVGYFLHHSFQYETFSGRILSVSENTQSRLTSVRLSSGVIVQVSFDGDDRPSSDLLNQCWHLSYHWSTKRLSNVYTFDSPFGGNVNDC